MKSSVSISVHQWLRILPLMFCSAIVGIFGAAPSAAASLDEQFVNPPASAKPWVWYRWHGYVTKEGITADLESLAEQGFGGFVLGFSDAGPLGAARIPSNLEFASPEFIDHVIFNLQEAQRLGLEVSIMPMNGWATTGGHWVKPEDREHVLIWDEALVSGPGRQTLQLTPPVVADAYYEDIAVLAFPVESIPAPTAFRQAAPGVAADLISTSDKDGKWNASPGHVTDGNPGSFISLTQPKPDSPSSVTLSFDAPFEASSLYLHPGPFFNHNLSHAKFRLMVSEDGNDFREVHTFDYHPEQLAGRSGTVIDLPEATKGKVWRLELVKQNWPFFSWLAEVELLQKGESPSTLARIPFGETHAGGTSRGARSILDKAWQTGEAALTQSGAVIDLSDRLQSDGTLEWDAPKGNWVVARIGFTDSTEVTSAGAFRSPAPNWESNKYSAEGARAFLEGFLDKLLEDPRMKPLLGTTVVGVQLDSWENAYHLWSDEIAEVWKERMPYALEPWLPALLGVTVNSPEETRRFLWDYRRLRADMVGDTFLKSVRDRVHAAGLELELEMTMFDRFKAFKYGDMPVTEFSPKGDHGGAGRLHEGIQGGVKMTASAGHIYNNPVISSEAFLAHERTFQPDHITPWLEEQDDGKRKFDRDPYALKSAGDKAFVQGVNRLGMHLYSHQPFAGGKPVMDDGKRKFDRDPYAVKSAGDKAFAQGVNRFELTLYSHVPDGRLPGLVTSYGTSFGRNLVWWPFAHAWADYLSRCQFLLQQGETVADFLFCLGEDAYMGGTIGGNFGYDLQSGYDFDFCAGQNVIELCSVEDGQIVLPSGRRYPLLVIGDLKEMTFPLVEKLAALVEQGATVIAPRPSGSPSLADQVAGRDPKFAALVKELWGGINGSSVKKNRYGKGRILWGVKIPDTLRELGVEPAMTSDARKLEFEYRRAGTDEIFFLSTQVDEPLATECRFNVSGKPPELWHPDTGRIEQAVAREDDGKTVMDFEFPANGSVFVVFRDQSTPGAAPPAAPLKAVAQIDGPWQVHFVSPFGETADKTFDTLASWRTSDDRFVKHFSGAAVYRSKFQISNLQSPMVLDLGEVWNVAQVTVNGQSFAPLWKPPFRVDISDALREGENDLQIVVRNTWVNRVIGDLNLPAAERKIWLPINHHTKDSPLRPGGLLGPVQLLSPVSTTD